MTYEGTLTSPPGRFAIVAARFNQFVVDKLVAGAKEGLRRHGVAEEAIERAGDDDTERAFATAIAKRPRTGATTRYSALSGVVAPACSNSRGTSRAGRTTSASVLVTAPCPPRASASRPSSDLAASP